MANTMHLIYVKGRGMEKLVIALNLIMDFIDSNTFVSEQDIADFLYNTGFDDYEIRQTLSMLNFNYVEKQPIFRHFSHYEKNKFTQDAMLYLQKLLISGFLDILSLEEIIEKGIEQGDSKITAEDIKQIVLMTILEKKSFLRETITDFDLLN